MLNGITGGTVVAAVDAGLLVVVLLVLKKAGSGSGVWGM